MDNVNDEDVGAVERVINALEKGDRSALVELAEEFDGSEADEFIGTLIPNGHFEDVDFPWAEQASSGIPPLAADRIQTLEDGAAVSEEEKIAIRRGFVAGFRASGRTGFECWYMGTITDERGRRAVIAVARQDDFLATNGPLATHFFRSAEALRWWLTAKGDLSV